MSYEWSPIGGLNGVKLTGGVVNHPPVDAVARMAACADCSWNIKNRCQHPAQGCAPCKQGIGLDKARLLPGFTCPLNRF